MKTEYCVYCDKKLTTKESQNITGLERKYHFILCHKHLAEERRNSVLLADGGINEEAERDAMRERECLRMPNTDLPRGGYWHNY